MSETQYYVDQNGHQYYLDQNGQPVYIDPIQPVQPASVPQQAYVEPSPIEEISQVQPGVTAQGNFAPPEDYSASVREEPLVAQGEAAADPAMYADQYGTQAAPAKSKLPIVFALVGSIGMGGVAAYVYNSQFGGKEESTVGGIPYIKASSKTAKVKPENSGGKVFHNTNKLIYDRIGGGGNTQPETLRAKSETPQVDTIAKAAAARAQAQKHIKVAEKKIGAPKAVKTFVVLPDGRVIKPGSNIAPPKAVVTPAVVQAPKVVKPVVQAAAPVKPVGDRRLFVNKNASVGANLSGSTPQRVQQRPPSTNGQFRYKPRRLASNTPMDTPAAPQAQAASSAITSGDFLLQLAARRSHDGALQAFGQLKQRYASILGTYSPDIQKADLGAKGIYYRLRVGPIDSKTAAMDVCDRLKEAGGDCLIRQK